jgi:hypothetical protein
MSVYRDLYFAALAGAFGGLIAWATGILALVAVGRQQIASLPDGLQLLAFGIFVGIALYLQVDRALRGKLRLVSVGYGLLFGVCGATLAVAVLVGFEHSLATVSVILFRLAVWTICLSLVSLVIGLRWVKTNPARVLHTYLGGLLGGLLGGGVFLLFAPHLSAGVNLVGLMLAGAGTSFGAGIAPMLVRDGVVRFISSGDARAQNKLGKQGKFWNLGEEESYVVGSAATAQGGTVFQQGADIWLPDTAIAPRHAVLFSKEGRYFIARHPDVSGPEGLAKYVLRVKGKTVTSSQELHPSDDVRIGRTALRFESRKPGE